MGETRVDLLHLLEDLRDAYPGAVEETILTEILANSLDSGAERISLIADPHLGTLTVSDTGSGMFRRDLARYHDIATSTKSRGQGIGFAGVGIKLGLLVSEEVLTETKKGKSHVATSWNLSSRFRAPWKWIPPQGLVRCQGTAIRLKQHNALSPLLDPGFLEGTIRRNYLPLFEPYFDPLLSQQYPKGVVIEIDGQVLERAFSRGRMKAPLAIRLWRKRKPSAMGYLVREELSLPEDQQGIGISTFGKIIKRGWDWLGISPNLPDRIGGLIEAPGLAASLTLNKGDFIRTGPRGAAYLAYRKAIQEVVLRQLATWGEARDTVEDLPLRQMRPLERDLERILEDLTDLFPLLGTLVEHKKGGQKRLPLGGPGLVEHVQKMVTSGLVPAMADKDDLGETQVESGTSEQEHDQKESPENSSTLSDSDSYLLPGKSGPRRPARLGLCIQFEDRPEDPELGRLVESTVWINQAHPAYRRAAASRLIGYHIALSVSLALAPLAVEPAQEHAFVTAFLSRWGEALGSTTKRKR